MLATESGDLEVSAGGGASLRNQGPRQCISSPVGGRGKGQAWCPSLSPRWLPRSLQRPGKPEAARRAQAPGAARRPLSLGGRGLQSAGRAAPDVGTPARQSRGIPWVATPKLGYPGLNRSISNAKGCARELPAQGEPGASDIGCSPAGGRRVGTRRKTPRQEDEVERKKRKKGEKREREMVPSNFSKAEGGQETGTCQPPSGGASRRPRPSGRALK